MFLAFNFSKDIKVDRIQLPNYSLQYQLDPREHVFENSHSILFLKTNVQIPEGLKTLIEADKPFEINQLKTYFKNEYFAVIVAKSSSKIEVIRDVAGIQSGYYKVTDNCLIISTMVHEIARWTPSQFNRDVVYQFLYSDYVLDGTTFYEDVYGFETGSQYTFDQNLKIVAQAQENFIFDSVENKLSEAENIKELREQIVKAHSKYTNDENIVLLSGGIDSVAMIIALDDLLPKDKIKAHSYKVKNVTNADETVYAKSIADHLNIDIDVFETELEGKITLQDLQSIVAKMNVPYCGVHFFMDNFEDSSSITYYAGQDTRLHTPSVNKIDLLAFSLFTKPKLLLQVLNVLSLLPRAVFQMFGKSSSRKLRGLLRASYSFDIESYLMKYYFNVNKEKLNDLKLPMAYFPAFQKKYNLDLTDVTNKRGLYNAIVKLKWKEQYVSDIRYMQDMANMKHASLAMPFYDIDLANFSATIPFELSTKTMLGRSEFGDKDKTVYKYILRMALKDKIDDKTFNRSKAAPVTTFALFNDSLNPIIKSLFKEDLQSENSFIKSFQLEEFIADFIDHSKWKEDDQTYLVKIYNTSALIIYHQLFILR